MEKKCILIGVTGGIAAFKICSLVSSLKKAGHEVHVIMTKEAEQFVTPLTFQSLSNQKVITDMFTIDYTPNVHHVSLAKKADAFVIAPATANIIAKVAHGIADDMLTTTFLAADCPKLIVPAMNTKMLENPITQDNIKACKKYGMYILDSASGYLACGDVGSGRMPEAWAIQDALYSIMNSSKERFLEGKNVLVTAGPTCEDIDPVRYITNHSSGKMGYALARAARDAGANVTLVAGQTSLNDPIWVNTIKIHSAEDLKNEVLSLSKKMDVIIMAAAVADYKPKNRANQKIKKDDKDFSIPLERTTDILNELGKEKKKNQTLIGFAMETENLIKNAQKKLKNKNADFIIANSISEKGAGFAGDTNRVHILSKDGQKDLGLLSKDETAEKILEYCLEK